MPLLRRTVVEDDAHWDVADPAGQREPRLGGLGSDGLERAEQPFEQVEDVRAEQPQNAAAPPRFALPARAVPAGARPRQPDDVDRANRRRVRRRQRLAKRPKVLSSANSKSTAFVTGFASSTSSSASPTLAASGFSASTGTAGREHCGRDLCLAVWRNRDRHRVQPLLEQLVDGPHPSGTPAAAAACSARPIRARERDDLDALEAPKGRHVHGGAESQADDSDAHRAAS